ncbi:hypothetical protein B0T22DRAFT_44390 [Podospora appendiculata]|uniref:Uncharacterized protein n=1 Tax=Podospora appendiculata TaxID=314037 RepID=A0AAE1CGM2_9PEZI|nr:hypothetical protein B0T22DRAFT_44390 [Podospora appendiculata]
MSGFDDRHLGQDVSYPPLTTARIDSVPLGPEPIIYQQQPKTSMLQPASTGGYTVSPASSVHRDPDLQWENEDGLASSGRELEGLSAAERSWPVNDDNIIISNTNNNNLGEGIPAPRHEQQSKRQNSLSTPGQQQWPAPSSHQRTRSHIPTATAHTPWQTQAHGLPLLYEVQPRQGDSEQEELAQARAKESLMGHGLRITSYGPAPVSDGDNDRDDNEDDDDDRIAPRAPPRVHRHQIQAHSHNHTHSQGPFMHYEDIAYLGPEPRDELHVAGGGAETFPPFPEGTNNPRARRSWDRQRRRRERGAVPSADGGDSNARGGERDESRRAPAFLEAICRCALVVPLVKGLDQLKWNWFTRGKRPLSDFQTFDDASRGFPSRLLWNRKGRVLGMSAAVVLLTVFLSSPLTQAAMVTHHTRLVPDENIVATVARSEAYSYTESQRAMNGGGLDVRQKQAIQLGLHQPVDEKLPEVQPTCSSGECHWRSFESLAICVDVADVSDKLSVSNQTNDDPVRKASLPNGTSLTSSGNLNLTSTTQTQTQTTDQGSGGLFLPAAESVAFASQNDKISSAIANVFVIYTSQTAEADDGEGTVFRAAEVLLHFCVNTYEVVASRGISTTTRIDSSITCSEGSGAKTNQTSILVLDAGNNSHTSQHYAVNVEDVRLLNKYIVSLFSGTYSVRESGLEGVTPTSETVGTALFNSQDQGDPENRLRAVVGNVATSLTNTIRTMGTTEVGVAFVTENYIQIQWGWMAFLAAQVAFSAAFLLGIMVQTAVWQVKVMKDISSIATLFAIKAEDKAVLGRFGQSAIMTRRAENITGKLGEGVSVLDLEM